MTTEVSGPVLADAIRARFPDSVVGAALDWVEVTPERLLDVCRFLHDDGAWMFRQLCSVTAVDWLTRFDMVYHLLSVHTNQRAVLKAALPDRESPVIDSVVPVWRGANLQEREVYDLFGIRFAGHPDLRRIFLWEGYSGWPLRKDFLQLPGHHPGLAGFPHEIPGEALDLSPRGTV